jgi:hypothetical protein
MSPPKELRLAPLAPSLNLGAPTDCALINCTRLLLLLMLKQLNYHQLLLNSQRTRAAGSPIRWIHLFSPK